MDKEEPAGRAHMRAGGCLSEKGLSGRAQVCTGSQGKSLSSTTRFVHTSSESNFYNLLLLSKPAQHKT